MASSNGNEQLRREQAQFYQDMVICVQSNNATQALIHDKNVAKSWVKIKTSSKCSCGRFFEQHPTFIEDLEEVSFEVFLQTIVNGHCICLESDCDTALTPGSGKELKEVSKSFIHVAAALGSIQLMTMLVQEANCDVNATTSVFHYTPLSLAVMQTRDDAVKWLCNQPNIKVNIKSKGEKHTPLFDAMLAEKFHLVEILTHAKGVDLNAKNFRKETPLIVAVRMMNTRLVRQLLEAGADYDVTTSDGVKPLMLAVKAGREVVQEFVDAKVPLDAMDSEGETALTRSVRLHTVDVTKVLMSGGANPRANIIHPAFILAAELGHLRTVAFFLDIGQDPNQMDVMRWTALHYACKNGFFTMAKMLLTCGALVDGPHDCRDSPIALAAFYRNLDIVQLLLSYGCKVDRFSEDMDTPLHFAAYSGDFDLFQLLLSHSQDSVCSFNAFGVSPLFIAVIYNHSNIIKCLLPFYTDNDLNTYGQAFHFNPNHIGDKLVHFEDISSSPLWFAAKFGNEEIIRALINAGFDASKEEWIHNKTFPMNRSDCHSVGELLSTCASTPSPLLCLCRHSVRRSLGPNKQRNANQLNIPRKLKNYIMLRD